MTPYQEALLAIEVAVDALQEADSESARDALAQIQHLGFDTRPSNVRKPETWVKTTKRTKQQSLFPA